MPDIFKASDNKGSANIPEGVKSKPRQKYFLLSAFSYMPEGIRFQTQEPGEEIILLLRRHWLTNMLWIVTSAILVLTPFFILPFFTFPDYISADLAYRVVIFILLAWYLFVFSYIFVNFLLWYFTVSIVSSERIIDIDFTSILNKKFSETRITRIEDVTFRTRGFVRSLFDYGDVYAQTAGTSVVFLFDAVPHPERVVRTMNNLMGREDEEHKGGE